MAIWMVKPRPKNHPFLLPLPAFAGQAGVKEEMDFI